MTLTILIAISACLLGMVVWFVRSQGLLAPGSMGFGQFVAGLLFVAWFVLTGVAMLIAYVAHRW